MEAPRVIILLQKFIWALYGKKLNELIILIMILVLQFLIRIDGLKLLLATFICIFESLLITNIKIRGSFLDVSPH